LSSPGSRRKRFSTLPKSPHFTPRTVPIQAWIAELFGAVICANAILRYSNLAIRQTTSTQENIYVANRTVRRSSLEGRPQIRPGRDINRNPGTQRGPVFVPHAF